MGFLKVSKWIFSTLLAGVTARSRLGGKNNRQVILAKEPHADHAARSILIGFGSFKGSDSFSLSMGAVVAAHAEVRGSLASKAPRAFDPYKPPACRERFVQAEWVTERLLQSSNSIASGN